MQYVQPYLSTIIQALVGLLVTLLLVAVATIRKKAVAYLESHATAKQRETLYRIAQEAFAYAESEFKAMGGQQKLEAAKGYLIHRLRAIGIDMTDAEIRGVIEKAVMEYNALTQTSKINTSAPA